MPLVGSEKLGGQDSWWADIFVFIKKFFYDLNYLPQFHVVV